MASLHQLRRDVDVVVRFAEPELAQLRRILFSRYPDREWATFGHFGWHSDASHVVLTLAALYPPLSGDLNEDVGHIAIAEPYSVRMALETEKLALAPGVFHSHPKEYVPLPSSIDDDMDSYYADYFGSFCPGRPYVSLILSQRRDETVVSGRVFWEGAWFSVSRVMPSAVLGTWGRRAESRPVLDKRRARLIAAFGEQAAIQLRESTVAVIGAGGTGSTAIEVLARAGVGNLIVVDPDHLEDSNLERVHGSTPSDAAARKAKVAVARDHVRAIDSAIRFTGYVGALPQEQVLNAVLRADVALGCTDQQHSRLALNDLSLRYLVPALDCGALLEGSHGRVTGQVAQFVRFQPSDPCVWCRRMVSPVRLSQELMSPEERLRRQTAAEEAIARGERGEPYWHMEPQLNTVGYHTTMIGAMIAGYAIGWLTGRFDPPFRRLQMNLVAPLLDVTDDGDEAPRADCVCRRIRGLADQGSIDALITSPPHWLPPIKLSELEN